jgi:hypothetical protein
MRDEPEHLSVTAEPDWAEQMKGGPGALWCIPEKMTVTGFASAVAPEHWQRLIDAANDAMADVAIQYGTSLIGTALGLGDVPLPTDTAFRHAAVLAHMVHPYTIAADMGSEHELAYYGEPLAIAQHDAMRYYRQHRADIEELARQTLTPFDLLDNGMQDPHA